ncbi:uncharacterized protein LOC126837281 [Adelges cooleyi]|uniref:uncharacterized protein LOC126837281 n=1 Tax=Adelges cooleyi TaxID=133065 RepID=UPI0021804EDF|nr:uncharacterized protein LOC126837281 [Adelges cooleyi]
MNSVYGCCVLLVVAIDSGALTVAALKDQPRTAGIAPTQAKRQSNQENVDFDPQQIPQEYLEYLQQTNAANNPVTQKSRFGQQNPQQSFIPRVLNNVFPPTTTTTLSPFAAEQVRIQQEYASQRFIEQQRLSLRQRPLIQSLLQQSQFQQLPDDQRFQTQTALPRQQFQVQPQFQSQPVTGQSQFRAQPQQQVAQQQFDQSQDLESQRNLQFPSQNDESFSFAQVRFGPTEASQLQQPAPAEPLSESTRSKGQRSVSKPLAYNIPDPVSAQQSLEYATINPVLLNARLLQNVVNVHHNGQMTKPTEETGQVVYIPKKKFYSSAPVSGTVAPVRATTANRVAQTDDAVVIPKPKYVPQQQQRPVQRPRQEGRKASRPQPQSSVSATEPPATRSPPAELLPDNFLTSLLKQFQNQAELTSAAPAKVRGGQRSNAAVDSDTPTRYIPDKSQLQLLQFADEQKSLSRSELKTLDDAGIQLQPAGDKSRQFAYKSRPVPQPVELDDHQRRYLASQGIRNLYRVDYDESGNALPLTYVLALDARPKRTEQQKR